MTPYAQSLCISDELRVYIYGCEISTTTPWKNPALSALLCLCTREGCDARVFDSTVHASINNVLQNIKRYSMLCCVYNQLPLLSTDMRTFSAAYIKGIRPHHAIILCWKQSRLSQRDCLARCDCSNLGRFVHIQDTVCI